MIVDLVSSVQREDWSRARQVIYQQWLTECPRLYACKQETPWESLGEEQTIRINSILFSPLVKAICCPSETETQVGHTLEILKEQAGLGEYSRAGQICGHVFKMGELTYSCNVCATDPTCVMCHNCFHKSEHKNHKYKIHSSNGSGYCDCGDPDAWKSGYACPAHLPKKDGETDSPQIPEDVKKRLKEVMTIILQYCCGMVCHEMPEEIQRSEKKDDKKLPFRIPEFIKAAAGEKDEITSAGQYIMILYNDETHTFDTVIRSLETHVPSVSRHDAMLIATIVDREGRCLVRYGTKNDCDENKKVMVRKARGEINRRTDKNDPLAIHVFESEVVVNQAHAVSLLIWINQQLEVFPLISDIIGDILLNELATPAAFNQEEMEVCENAETLLVKFMRYDKKLWKIVRQNIHQMLMKTVLMKYDQKVALAKTYFKYYDEIYNDFIDDDHELEMSIVSLAVQFLTVPSLARRLIAEDDVIAKVWNSVLKHTLRYCRTEPDGTTKQPPIFDFATRQFPVVLKRALHMLRDLAFILNLPPTPSQWNDSLRNGFVRGVEKQLDFISRMQGMDEVKRQAQEHQVWEMEWESAFNIQIRIQEVLTLTQLWAYSDKLVHRELLLKGLDLMSRYKPAYGRDEGSTKETGTVVKINGEQYACPQFDVLHGVVSIHQPLCRFVAGLFAAGQDYLRFFNSEVRTSREQDIVNKIKDMGKNLFEESLRVTVLCAQVSSQLWRRNGFSLINQIHNYYSPICRVEMYDRDLLMMQVAAVLNDPKDLIFHIITRYRLAGWADLDFTIMDMNKPNYGPNMDKDETSKIVVTLAEEMLHLLINIAGERYLPGVGKATMAQSFRRELIHLLCSGPHPFSQMSEKMGRFQLMRKMSNDPSFEKIQLHDIVSEIAECKKLTATTPGQFHLKDSCLKEYSPFFYHYSKSNVSAAELHQQKIRSKMDRSLIACPPPIPCEFEPFFKPVVNILKCPVLVRLCRAVLERTQKRSRYSSDRLLHRVLYLVGMALQEQEKTPTEFDYLTPAAEEGIFKLLEELNGTSDAGTHADLLWWTIQKYKTVERLVKAEPEVAPMEEVADKQDTPATAKAKREMIARKKALALQRIKKMQDAWIPKGETTSPMEVEESEDVAMTGCKKRPQRTDDDEDWASLESDDVFPVCLGNGRSRVETVLPRKVTCMLCQEEEILQPGHGNFVCAAYVQRSLLFTQHENELVQLPPRHDFVNAALPVGLDTSTCSHVMHYDCYQGLTENLLNRERNRPRQQMQFTKMIDIDQGEYLCPLCKRLSNTALPVLPALPLMNVKGFSTVRSAVVEDFDTWVARVKELLSAPPLIGAAKPKTHSRKRSHSERSLVDLAKQGDDLSSMSLDNNLSTSVPTASTMQLLLGEGPSTASNQQQLPEMDESILRDPIFAELAAILREGEQPASGGSSPNQQPKSPSAVTQLPPAVQELLKNFQTLPNSALRIIKGILPKNKNITGPSYEKYSESIRVFAKFLIKTMLRESLTGEVIKGFLAALCTWQSAAHVVRNISSILQAENKPLFGALNTRQRDCISALTRLSAALAFYMQNMPLHMQVMLRSLLSSPPSPTASQKPPESPKASVQCFPHPSISTETPTSPSSSTKENFVVHFFTTHQKLTSKEALINVLHIDMLNLAISLSMCIGWTWVDSRQSFKQPTRQRDLLPDGSADELYCIRLCLCGLLFQVVASFVDSDMAEEEQIDDTVDARICELWTSARPNCHPLVDKKRLRTVFRDTILGFLRPLALFYSNLTMVSPPEALRDPSVDEFEPLCRYMGFPSTLAGILDGAAILSLFQMWSAAIPNEDPIGLSLVKQPIKANQLIDLPEDFSDLIQMATAFRCPTVPFDEPASNMPTICLVCGTVLCSQSYCCQRQIGKESVGACRYHMQNCSGSIGMFLRIRDCIVVLMTTRSRGCIRPAPYVDEFGESDQGFRRGNPLHLNPALYQKLKQLWMSQGIAEEIVNQFEIDHRNIQFDFVNI